MFHANSRSRPSITRVMHNARNVHKTKYEGRESSVGIVDKLQPGRQRSRGSIPGRGKIFSPAHNVQTGSEAHPGYPMGTGGSFPRGQAVGA
jgi:hypothetical protein